ncbi:MAG: hypothetical protein WDZ41_04925 [Candidatus Babeliales bacterium]
MMKNKNLLLVGLFGLSSLLCYGAEIKVEKPLSSITNNTKEDVIVMIKYMVPGEADIPTLKSESTTKLMPSYSFETDLTPKYGRGRVIYEKQIIATTNGKIAQKAGKAGQHYRIIKSNDSIEIKER